MRAHFGKSRAIPRGVLHNRPFVRACFQIARGGLV